MNLYLPLRKNNCGDWPHSNADASLKALIPQPLAHVSSATHVNSLYLNTATLLRKQCAPSATSIHHGSIQKIPALHAKLPPLYIEIRSTTDFSAVYSYGCTLQTNLQMKTLKLPNAPPLIRPSSLTMTCYSKDSPQLIKASKKLRARLRQPKAESSLRIWPCYKPPYTTIKKPPNIATLHNHTLRIWLQNRIAPPNPPKKDLQNAYSMMTLLPRPLPPPHTFAHP
jgi:hypothetical protein